MTNIGLNYSLQEDFSNSLNYFKKARDIGQQLDRKKDFAGILLNISDSYKGLDQMDSSRSYSQQAYELAIKINDSRLSGLILSNFGEINSKMGQNSLALDYYRLALSSFTNTLENDAVCETMIGMAYVFNSLGQLDSCFYYAKHSIMISESNGLLSRSMSASNIMVNYYRNIDVDSAFKYQTNEINIKDSLFSQRKVWLIQSLTLNEAFRQQQVEFKKRQSEDEASTLIQFFTILLILILLVIFFVPLSLNVNVRVRTIKRLGIIGLLLSFEYVNLLVHSFLGNITHHIPVLMLIGLTVIAIILVPMHNKVESLLVSKYLPYIQNKRILNLTRKLKLEEN